MNAPLQKLKSQMLINTMTTQNESLEERLQREARNKIWEKLTDSDSLWTTVDEVISHTIAETKKTAVCAIKGAEKANIPVLPARGSKPSEYHKAGQVIGFNNGLTTAITAVEGVGKSE